MLSYNCCHCYFVVMQMYCVTVTLISNISIPIRWECDSMGMHVGYCQEACLSENLTGKLIPKAYFTRTKFVILSTIQYFDHNKSFMLSLEDHPWQLVPVHLSNPPQSGG